MTDQDIPYFPADVEVAERNKAEALAAAERNKAEALAAAERAKQVYAQAVQHRLAATGGRLACPHPVHRVAQVPNSPARLILPECAGREAWLAARRDGIGGSEVGALIGVNEHETAWSIWNKKTRTTPDKELTGAPIEWGHRLEEVVAQKTAQEIGLVSRFAGGLWAWPDKPHIRVTPDRFACKPRQWKALGIIECKTAGDDEHWESGTIRPKSHGTGQAPLGYQAQLQWQLGILGLEVGWLGCFHIDRSRQFFTVEVHFDKEWFAEMVHAADTLWTESIKADLPPLHDLRHPVTEELLKAQHPSVIHPSVQLPDDADVWLADYKAAKAAADAAIARLDEIKNYFRMWTGDAGAGYLGEKKVVSYPEVPSSRIDVTALRERFPEVAEAVTVKSHYRRMTIRPPKEK